MKKVKGFCKPGQSHCFNCGEKFVVGNMISDTGADTTCPNNGNRDMEYPCNNGSWIHWEPDSYYCIPVEMESEKFEVSRESFDFQDKKPVMTDEIPNVPGIYYIRLKVSNPHFLECVRIQVF